MSEGQPISPAELGIDEDELGLDDRSTNKLSPEQELPEQPPATLDDSDSGASESSSSQGGGESTNLDQSKLSQSAGGAHSAATKHGSSSHGEGIIDNFKELAEGVEEESGLGNMTK